MSIRRHLIPPSAMSTLGYPIPSIASRISIGKAAGKATPMPPPNCRSALTPNDRVRHSRSPAVTRPAISQGSTPQAAGRHPSRPPAAGSAPAEPALPSCGALYWPAQGRRHRHPRPGLCHTPDFRMTFAVSAAPSSPAARALITAVELYQPRLPSRGPQRRGDLINRAARDCHAPPRCARNDSLGSSATGKRSRTITLISCILAGTLHRICICIDTRFTVKKSEAAPSSGQSTHRPWIIRGRHHESADPFIGGAAPSSQFGR